MLTSVQLDQTAAMRMLHALILQEALLANVVKDFLATGRRVKVADLFARILI